MDKATNNYHIPALLNECIQALHINPSGIYVDVTFGGGGHSKAILQKLNDKGRLYVFDQDNDAASNIPDDERIVFIQHNFRYIAHFLEFLKATPVDGILADLGISSFQINEAGKGFAHRLSGDIDMRMDRSSKLHAGNIINQYSEKQLLDIFNKYGEIKNTYKLVQTILTARKNTVINSIDDFKKAIESCIPSKEESKYLSQVFQALRIEVNKELLALEMLLTHTSHLLKKGGRLAIISYHSLEDRIVKNFMQTGNISGEINKDEFGNWSAPFKALNKKPIIPTDKEIEENKRARSAKLRVAEKN